MSPWKSSLLNDNSNIEIIIFITNSKCPLTYLMLTDVNLELTL